MDAVGRMLVMAVMVGISFLLAQTQLWLLAVEIVFVVAIGALSATMSRRRSEDETALRSQGRELGERLDSLQRELEDERVISRVGENVARLAHGLKNAVHSLRGFVSLIEGQLERGPGTNAALAGLHAAATLCQRCFRVNWVQRRHHASVVLARSFRRWTARERGALTLQAAVRCHLLVRRRIAKVRRFARRFAWLNLQGAAPGWLVAGNATAVAAARRRRRRRLASGEEGGVDVAMPHHAVERWIGNAFWIGLVCFLAVLVHGPICVWARARAKGDKRRDRRRHKRQHRVADTPAEKRGLGPDPGAPHGGIGSSS